MGVGDNRERVWSLNVEGPLCNPSLTSLAPLPYLLVRPHATVGPSRVPGVEDLLGVSIHPGWTQRHTEELRKGEGKEQPWVPPWVTAPQPPPQLCAAGNSPTIPTTM